MVGFENAAENYPAGTNVVFTGTPVRADFETLDRGEARRRLGIPADRCLVVEDAVSGAEAGHAGGMKVACVGDAARNGAGDWNMESIRELVEIVKG